MISENNKRKFQAIVAKMTPEQRASLMSHIKNAPENQREAIIEQIVARYEQHQEAIASPKNTVSSSNSNVSNNNDNVVKPPVRKAPKKKKKNNSKAILWVIVALLVIAIIAFVIVRKDSLMEAFGIGEPSETVMETEVTPTPTPLPTNTPTPSPTPAPTIVPLAEDHPDLTGMTIVIDPGHQQTTDSEQETYASWLSATKPRCTSGGTGVVSGKPEYELTLEYSMIIRDYLTQCGADVIMIREANDVDISNQERANMAVEANPDLFLRIHADSANDPITSGVRVYIPSNGSYTDTSPDYANLLALLVAQAEGLDTYEAHTSQNYTGLNYANTIRSFQLSLGFLSNSDDEEILLNENNMGEVAQAISEFCFELINEDN